MPSPIGHALAGIAAGWLVAPAPPERPAVVTRVLVFAAAAVAPDLDLLVGAHSGPSHGIGAAVLVGMGVFLWVRAARAGIRDSGLGTRSQRFDRIPNPESRIPVRLAAAAAVAYATHTLLDWLGTDTSAPIGIMALWPFSREYYESSLHVFMAISRRYWLPEFWTYNVLALARELLILVPLVAACVMLRRPR